MLPPKYPPPLVRPPTPPSSRTSTEFLDRGEASIAGLPEVFSTTPVSVRLLAKSEVESEGDSSSDETDHALNTLAQEIITPFASGKRLFQRCPVEPEEFWTAFTDVPGLQKYKIVYNSYTKSLLVHQMCFGFHLSGCTWMNMNYAKMKDVLFLVRTELSEYAFDAISKDGLLEVREEKTFMDFKSGSLWELSARTPDWCIFCRSDDPKDEKPLIGLEIGVSQVLACKKPAKPGIYRHESLEEKAHMWLLASDDGCRVLILVDVSKCEAKTRRDKKNDVATDEQGHLTADQLRELEMNRLEKEVKLVLGAGCMKVAVQVWRLNKEGQPEMEQKAEFKIQKDEVAWRADEIPQEFPANITIRRSDIGLPTNDPQSPPTYDLPLVWLRNDLIERRKNHMKCSELVKKASKRRREANKEESKASNAGPPRKKSVKSKT